MSRQTCVRIASGLGVVSLAVFFVGLLPFLSADPTAGAGLVRRTPGFSVNREFKSDRLPVAAVSATPRRPIQQQHSEKIPVGCDASFSSISAPGLSHIYGRCMT